MVQDPNADTFTAEVEERLESLFGDLEPDSGEEEQEQESPAPKQSPFTELKTIVLSIDWEITDEVMDRFVAQVTELQGIYKDDKIVLVFLQLLGSIGDYIRTNLGQSHPDAFRILNSLFAQLDRVLHAEGLSDAEKKKILGAELARYKKLKTTLQQKQSSATAKTGRPEKEKTAAAPVENPIVPASLMDRSANLRPPETPDSLASCPGAIQVDPHEVKHGRPVRALS